MVTKCGVLMSFTMVPISMHGMPIFLHMDLDNMLIINNKISLQQHGFVFNNCDNITHKLKFQIKIGKITTLQSSHVFMDLYGVLIRHSPFVGHVGHIPSLMYFYYFMMF